MQPPDAANERRVRPCVTNERELGPFTSQIQPRSRWDFLFFDVPARLQRLTGRSDNSHLCGVAAWIHCGEAETTVTRTFQIA